MNGNELAFPSHFGGTVCEPELGLTKREWFAGLAMQGLIANRNYGSQLVHTCSYLAVEHADALIATLNAEPQS